MLALLRYVFEFILAWVVWRFLSRGLQQVFGARIRTNPSDPPFYTDPSKARRPTITGKTARDPVCGMFVSTELSQRLQRNGQTLHFCSRECMERYQKQGSGTRGR
jgi:YHS domain-containing protein